MRFAVYCSVAAVLAMISVGCDNSAPSNSRFACLLTRRCARRLRRLSLRRMATSAPATQASATPINKFCAVEHEDEVDPKVTTVYNGKIIGFCCKDCVPKFKQDPERYMASLK